MRARRHQRLRQQLVLAGGGHSHVLLLRRWIMRPSLRPADTAVVLVNRASTALYSGMVPAVVAGLHAHDSCAIDLRDLARRADVTFVRAEILGLNLDAFQLNLRDRPPLSFDQLSLDVGCQTRWHGAAGEAIQTVKPLEPFFAWLQERLLQPGNHRVRIRGGGAAAVELAFALRARGLAPELLLRQSTLSLGSAAANRAAERWLHQAGVRLHRCVSDGEKADLACTGSEAPAWLAASGLSVDPRSGRVLTEATLKVRGHDHLFASGDCAVIASDPRPPSGVWAVRAAPVLVENLRRTLDQPGKPLRTWRPQRRALQLLGDGGASTAQPRALALYGPWSVGPAVGLWRLKDWIDRRFMASFRSAPAMDAAEPMACRGCAAKLPSRPLNNALARLQGTAALGRPEDASLVATNVDGEQMLQSVDGFPALLDDPWLNARLTTLHACSDLWACGARLHSVQVLLTVPEAAANLQQEWLFQSLAGVRSVLDPLAVPLLGGHTMEGRDGAGLALALSVNGVVPAQRHWPKGPLPQGSLLLITRPIGSGVLFAAGMAGRAVPAWIDKALDTMQQPQAALVELLADHSCMACTDITGFGLLGHLGEMLGSGQKVRLTPAAIPAFDGALPLLEQGLASTLAPANAEALALLEPGGAVELDGLASAAQQQLWIDPQTCGPLLAALPASRAPQALAALHRAGFARAALIGEVL